MPSRAARAPGAPRHIQRAALVSALAEVFDAVRRGETVVVDEGDEPRVAIIDMTDFHILRAVTSYYAERPAIEPEAGLSDGAVADLTGQELFNVTLSHYLSDAISLSRAAEILKTAWVELRSRFARLGVPLRTAPESDQEAWEDVLAARAVASG
jgi:hypothetical protein